MDLSSSLRCLKMELDTTLAQTALAYFNSNQGTKFEFVKLGNKAQNCCPNSLIHLNFIATDDGGGGGGEEVATKIFYAEILRSWESDDTSEDEDEEEEDREVFVSRMRESLRRSPVEVKGCALLEKVDTGNPLGMRCTGCDNMSVIHPGPHSGYRVLAGDKFESSDFMKYNPFKVMVSLHPESAHGFQQSLWPPRRSKVKHTADNLVMFNTCANLALERFNHAQGSEFRMVKVDVGYSVTTFKEKFVHVNFLAEWPGKLKKPRLFFAEVVASIVVRQRPWVWDPSLVKSIKVEGCCQLSYKKGFGSVFGRVCGMCVNDVIHPGPRDGYTIAAGDLFQGYKFMEAGNGIY